MVINIMFYGKDIWSQKHHGNQNRHSLPMVTCWHSTNNESTSLKHTMMEMNSLDATMWTIMDIFDDIYFDLNLILLAITMDKISTLLEQEPAPPYIFNPFQTIGKYCWSCLLTEPHLPPLLSLPIQMLHPSWLTLCFSPFPNFLNASIPTMT